MNDPIKTGPTEAEQKPEGTGNTPPEQSGQEQSPTETTRWQTLWLMMWVLILPLAGAAWLTWDESRTRQVVSTVPIGKLVRASGWDGFRARLLVETEQGIYPLYHAVSLVKGTPMTLDTRGSGRRFLCDQARTLCVETTAETSAIPRVDLAGRK